MAGDAVASSAGSSSVAIPKLKGRHAAFMNRHLAIGIALSFASVYLTKVFVNDKRKAAYAEYYANYDIDANFQRLRKLGHFQSCGPDDEE